MALPFGVWDGSEAFQRAQDFEEEQDEQMYEEKLTETDDFIVRLAPTSRGLMQSMDGGRKFLKVSQLIVTSDYIGTAFVDSYLMNQGTTVKIGVVTGPFDSSPTGNTICQASLWDKTCFLYSLDGGSDTVICQMKHSMDQKFLFNWVDKVFDVIQPSSVVLLSAIPKSKFQLEEVRNSGLDALYQLQSDSCERTTIFPTLPRPNLVGDLPAAVLTHCQIKSIPAILYILATESIHFDVTAVKSFAPILNEDILNGISKDNMCIRLLHGLAFPGVYSERVRFTSLVGENCAPIQVVASRLSTVIATLCTAICSAPFEHLTSASWNEPRCESEGSFEETL